MAIKLSRLLPILFTTSLVQNVYASEYNLNEEWEIHYLQIGYVFPNVGEQQEQYYSLETVFAPVSTSSNVGVYVNQGFPPLLYKLPKGKTEQQVSDEIYTFTTGFPLVSETYSGGWQALTQLLKQQIDLEKSLTYPEFSSLLAFISFKKKPIDNMMEKLRIMENTALNLSE